MKQQEHRAPRRTRSAYLGRAGALLLLALFVALLVYGLVSKSPDTSIDSSLADGRAAPAPSFDLALFYRGRVDGRLGRTFGRAARDGKIALGELRGIPVVLNFWASWCLPCRDEAPRLERHWQASRKRGVLVLGLDVKDLTGDGKAFIDEFELSYPSVRDGGDDVARDWGVTGLPETFFISARGRVVGHVIGAVSNRQLVAGTRAARDGRALAIGDGGARRGIR